MRQLLNTLFVTSEDIYLSLDGENVVANRGGEAVARYPLHTLQSIVTFSYAGASPTLMGKCAQREIGLAFCSQRGKFLARVSGQMQGNVLLRGVERKVKPCAVLINRAGLTFRNLPCSLSAAQVSSYYFSHCFASYLNPDPPTQRIWICVIYSLSALIINSRIISK